MNISLLCVEYIYKYKYESYELVYTFQYNKY